MSGHHFPTDLPVVISFWEIECCGSLPTVGEPSTWRLVFQPVATPDMDSLDRIPGSVTEFQWQVEFWSAGDTDARALYRDGFAAYVYPAEGPAGNGAGLPAPGRAAVRGVVSGTRHGGTEHDLFPQVTALVRRIQVVSRNYRRDGRQLTAVPGTTRLRDVQQSPKWFSTHPHSRPTSRTTRNRPSAADQQYAETRDEIGLLLHLCATAATTGEEPIGVGEGSC